MSRIPLSNIVLTDAAKAYGREAIDTGWVSGTGPFIARFEGLLAERVERRYAIAVANGTVALELALRALGIGPGHEVIVPALTFIAPVAMVVAVGATPVFVDINEESWTVDPEQVERRIGPNTRAILAVDLLGHPCDFRRLEGLGPTLIEDAAEAHGAFYDGRPAGSFGQVSTLSFHANKSIATGEGGAAVTDSAELAAGMRLLANHGMSAERPYWHPVVGHNFRMTNVTAGLGLGQAEQWTELIEARSQVAAGYDRRLTGTSVARRPVAPWAREACWLYTVTHPDRERIVARLQSCGIDARAIWHLAPGLPPYQRFASGRYPVAERISRTAFWLPTWAFMGEDLLDRVAQAVAEAADPGVFA